MASHCGDDLVGWCALDQILSRSARQPGRHLLRLVADRQEDHARLRVALTQDRGRSDAVEPRHRHVHQNHIGRVPVGELDGLVAVRGLVHDLDVRLTVEQPSQHATEGRVVVDEKDADRHAGVSIAGVAILGRYRPAAHPMPPPGTGVNCAVTTSIAGQMTQVQEIDDPGTRALVAVTEVGVDPTDVTGEIGRLLRVIVDALGAHAAVLQAADARAGRFTVLDAVNLAAHSAGMDDTPLTEGVAGQAHFEGTEHEVDQAGLPDALRAAGLNYAVALPVRTAERSHGVIWVAGAAPLSEDALCRHAARVGAERVGSLLEQVRLSETLERAMAQILEGDERMLGRIGLDIHDGPTQQLSVALLEVQLLEADLDDVEAQGTVLPDKLRPSLVRIYETLGGALQEMRELIGHLRPAQFEDRDLPEILQIAVRACEAQYGMTVDSEAIGEFPDTRVSLSQKITFYRILQEALNNAARHGQATEVVMRLREGPAGITMEVRDNGRGFAADDVRRPTPGNPQARFGLFGMRDRAQLLGGSLDVWSRLGQGALITVFLPRWKAGERGRLSQLHA